MRHRLEDLGVGALTAIVRLLPDRIVRLCGTIAGLLVYAVDRGHRRVAQRNLEAAFPGRPRRERRRIVRGAFKHFGRLLLELLKFSTLTPAEMLARVEVEGE